MAGRSSRKSGSEVPASRTYRKLLALGAAELGHHLVYYLFRNGLWKIERTAVRHDFYCLACGIVKDLASAALREMQFELLADFGRDAAGEIVPKFGHELIARDHLAALPALAAK